MCRELQGPRCRYAPPWLLRGTSLRRPARASGWQVPVHDAQAGPSARAAAEAGLVPGLWAEGGGGGGKRPGQLMSEVQTPVQQVGGHRSHFLTCRVFTGKPCGPEPFLRRIRRRFSLFPRCRSHQISYFLLSPLWFACSRKLSTSWRDLVVGCSCLWFSLLVLLSL